MDIYFYSVQLVITISVLTLFCAVAWALMATPLNIYRQASKTFAVGNLSISLGFAISVLRDDATPVTLWLFNDLLLFGGFYFYKKAVYALFRLRESDLFDVTVLLSVLVLIIWSVFFSPSLAHLSAITAVLCMTALILTAKANILGLRNDIGVLKAVGLCLPAIMISIVMGGKAILLLFTPELAAKYFIRPQVDSPEMLWGYFVALLFANASAFGATLMKMIIKIRMLADHDQLTGLLNRRAIKHELATAKSHFLRNDTPYSLLLVDVDFFKNINDKLGHEAGDEAIKHVAATLKSSLRETDKVCRYGGEEFLVLLHQCKINQALQTAEKLRATIADSTFFWSGKKRDISVSIGCSGTCTEADPERLLSQADNQLYAAKAQGRNRVMPASLLASSDVC